MSISVAVVHQLRSRRPQDRSRPRLLRKRQRRQCHVHRSRGEAREAISHNAERRHLQHGTVYGVAMVAAMSSRCRHVLRRRCLSRIVRRHLANADKQYVLTFGLF